MNTQTLVRDVVLAIAVTLSLISTGLVLFRGSPAVPLENANDEKVEQFEARISDNEERLALAEATILMFAKDIVQIRQDAVDRAVDGEGVHFDSAETTQEIPAVKHSLLIPQEEIELADRIAEMKGKLDFNAEPNVFAVKLREIERLEEQLFNMTMKRVGFDKSQ